MTESGTYVNGQLEGLHRGEKIARWTTEKKSRSGNTTIVGGVLTHVLRPVEETYMEERIDYVTPYSLIDFERTSVINPAEFPDLELTARRIPVVLDEVVTINRFGELVHLDSNHQAKDHGAWKGLMDRQRVLWDHLRQKDTAQGANAELLRSNGDSMKREAAASLNATFRQRFPELAKSCGSHPGSTKCEPFQTSFVLEMIEPRVGHTCPGQSQAFKARQSFQMQILHTLQMCESFRSDSCSAQSQFT